MGTAVGMGLADLTHFMQVLPPSRIVPDQVMWNDTYDIFKGAVSDEEFDGLYMEHLIQTSREFTGRGHGREVNLPYGGKSGYIKAFTPLRRLVATATVDQETMDRAKGVGAAGNYVLREIQQMLADFRFVCELAAIGYPDGGLARSNGVGVQCTVAGVTDDGAGTCVKITCDNTYRDFGMWENVQLIRKGQRVEVYLADGTTNATAAVNAGSTVNAGHAVVKMVVPAYRTSAGAWAATNTGYVVVQCGSIAEAHTLANAINDGSIIHVYGTKSNTLYLPAGMSALLQNHSVGTYIDGHDTSRDTELWVPDANYGVALGFTRASYDVLNTPTYDAEDFGAVADTPAAGTPCYWVLSNLRDWINTREMETGCEITHLAMALEMAECLDRMNVREHNITVNVGNVQATSQAVFGGGEAKTFRKSNNSTCKIVTIRGFSKHTIAGIAAGEFKWGVKGGGFDYFRLYGTEWQPVMAQRWDSFEAPYGGYSQLAADRVDCNFVANDLRYDI